ncbi:membrane protein [Vibrio ishigakensis]|uniref:Arginine/ornithine antiporter arcD n=1 Tax=Vibrio ishigakensis TaxID=1481914 RepID=A0A0B8PCF6_9VIBR|nr:membrane protein [Vibrio ishigakensis]GAM77521.1 arginine/ornithine antiporter arcD [Vibrio ishigakensis]
MKKTISFAFLHFTIAFSVAYILTGDIILGSLIAMTEPAVNTVAFYFHELVWQRSSKLREIAKNPKIKTASFAAVHFSVAFSVVYLLTGDALAGGIIALLEPSINTVAYYFHEKVWLKIQDNRFAHA